MNHFRVLQTFAFLVLFCLPAPEILTLGGYGLACLLPDRAGLDVESEAQVRFY